MLRPSIGRLRGSGRRRVVAGVAALLVLPVGFVFETALTTQAATPNASAAAIPIATGDSRSVSEPSLPSTVCKTLTAALAMSSRKASSSQEASPPDTSRIQSALNSCTQGGPSPVAVKLVAGSSNTAFLSGPLTIPAGVALVLDSNVTLFASLNPASYQVSGASSKCGTAASSSGGCKPFISVNGANSGIEAVRASSGSQGRIDGRGDLPMYGTNTSWFTLAANAHAQSLSQNNPRLIQADRSNNFVLYNIDLLNAANFHVVYENATGFTAWGVHIKTPANADNTDGIDPSGAVNVTIANSYIMDGDDGIAVKAGSVASKNITVKNNHFYGTHGISIGSETAAGVTNMLVQNNTITGVDANGVVGGSPLGLRIKSNSSTGGTVNEVSYLNNCITQVRQPLVFDTHYFNVTGSRTPYFTNILVNGLRSTGSMSGGTSVISGYNASHPIGVTLMNVALDKTTATAQYATVGLYNSNLKPSGTGVNTSTVSGSGAVPSCSFPTYPSLSSTASSPTSTSASTPTVASDGTGTYRTVQAAINAVPANNTKPVTITIKPGTYREIVTIPANKPYITLQGLGSTANSTLIVDNHSNAGGYGTGGSASVFVYGHDFTAKNLTISNDYGVGSQAVATNVSAQRAIFNNVRFLGNQDTLLVNDGARAYFVNNYIEGTVDFIFGGGTAVFNTCNIYEKRTVGGPVTAARTPSTQTYGFLIYKSTITGAVNNTTQLGRPWGPAAQVLYRESTLSATIATGQPWINMSTNPWTKARFSEYKDTGPGATHNNNRPQMTDAQAANYTPQKYLVGSDGWNPIG